MSLATLARTFLGVAGIMATDAVASVLVAALALVPGGSLAVALCRRLGWDLPSVLLSAFAVSAGLVAASGLLAHYAGWGLTAATVLFVVLAVGVSLLGARLGHKGARLPVERPVLVVGLLTALVASIEGTYFFFTADSFYHMSGARSLIALDRPLVTDPLHGTTTELLDPTSGAWHTMLAIWSKLTGADVAFLWTGLGIVCSVLVALAVWSLCRRVSRDDDAATIAAIAFLIGAVFLDFRLYALPNRGSMALILGAIVGLVALAETPSWAGAVLASAAGFAASAVHIASAELVYVAGALIFLWLGVEAVVRRVRGGGWNLAPAIAVFAVTALIVLSAVPVLLPKVGLVSGSEMMGLGSLPRADENLMRLPGGWLMAVPGKLIGGGPVLFALATVLAFWMGWKGLRDGDRSAVAGFALASIPALLLTNPPVTTFLLNYSGYMTARIGALLRFTPYVAIAWGLAQYRARRRDSAPVFVAAMAVAVALYVAAPFMQRVFTGGGERRKGENFPVFVTRARDIRFIWRREDLADVRRLVDGRYPRVAGHPETTYYLGGLVPVSQVAALPSHSPLAIEQADGPERRADMERLLALDATEAERRRLLERWDADYVALWVMRKPELDAYEAMKGQTGLLEEVHHSRNLVLLRVKG